MALSKPESSIGRVLMGWFSFLSIFPLVIVAIFSYQQTRESLLQQAAEMLQQSSGLTELYIRNWFDYRKTDLLHQAEFQSNAQLLQRLIKGWKRSGLDLSEYVDSDDWALQVKAGQETLVTFTQRYDYLYDLFLIDREGNILFTVARESDLGTNLQWGSYSKTRFAMAFRNTLATGKVTFSDLERYLPSNNAIDGFLTTPLLDQSGDPIGIFAMKLRFHRVDRLLYNQEDRNLTHYLIGEDGLLRTAIGDSQQEVLSRRISTEIFKMHRQLHHGIEGVVETPDKAQSYLGPNGQAVIGLHKEIKLPGTSWILISELNETKVLELANLLGIVILGFVVMVSLAAIGFAFFQARRFVQPIVQLAIAANRVAKGDTGMQVAVSSRNEIGMLADAFNHMLSERQGHERILKQNHLKTQQALANLDEQRYVLDQHAIVAVTDLKGTITYANKKFALISGYSVDELIGQNHRILNSGKHTRQFWREMYRTACAGGIWNAEVCNRAKNGELYWVDTTIAAFKGEGGKPQAYIAIRTDISCIKQSEHELIIAKEAAEHAAQAKSEFLAVMSHEIRTPMNGVLGMLGLVRQSRLNQDQRRKLKLAHSSAQSLLTLINDILDFSKVDAGKLELEEIDFNLRRHLDEFAGAMAYKAHEKGLELILDTASIGVEQVKSDPGRIRQILTNLVGNAIKFTEQGEIVIRANLSTKDQTVIFSCSVSDTGTGIAEETLNGLFDPFTQADATTTRKYGGTGLGLAIVKRLCNLMGGTISVTSEPGQGSCFTFTLPLQLGEQPQLAVPSIDYSGLRVLVVDDNETNREVLRGQLEFLGVQVVEAANGPEALALCESCDLKRPSQSPERLFDAALLDLQMPGMDGAELGKILQTNPQYRPMKLVMMTSQAHRGDAKLFSELGFSAYFPKPATASDLTDALAVVVEGGEALQQASPLVTKHYLKTLIPAENGAINRSDDKSPVWPINSRLLIVEDNYVNQEVVSGMLENIGLYSDLAADGVEALESLRQAPDSNPYTLVLMDCQMPRMDGYEASRQIRQGLAGNRYKTLPIVAMTANAMKGDKEKCLSAGMSDYLAKPLDSSQLKTALITWLITDSASTMADAETVSADSQQIASVDSADDKVELTPVWDKKRALDRVENNEQSLQRLVLLFLEDVDPYTEKLRQQIEKPDLRSLRQWLHTVKSIAGTLCCLQVQHKAMALEQQIKVQESTDIREGLVDLLDAFQQLVSVLEQYLMVEPSTEAEQSTISEPSKSVTPVKSYDNKSLRQLFSTLASRLQKGDYIDCSELGLMAGDTFSDPLELLIQDLLKQLKLFDSDGALASIEKILFLLDRQGS
ncbi:hypothetical protein BGP75_16380 [Motiliproteus sp. MSK22-1]|nr:hypothetical protein BGP75_16380 [Motiliproteus sp. MSK22-1]